MSGCKHAIWKTLSAGAALFLLLPTLALGEIGVCPPYSKTFGPDDPLEEIGAFLTEINLRPGGGTLVLEPGTYGSWREAFVPGEFFVSGVVCVESSSGPDDLPQVYQRFHVQSGGILTVTATALRAHQQNITVSVGGTVFASAAWINAMEVSGMAYVVDTSMGYVTNIGTLIMVRGGMKLPDQPYTAATLRNEGVAFLDRIVVRNAFGHDNFDTYEGGLKNHDGGVLTLSGASMAGNYGCYCGLYCGCGGDIFNEAGGVLNVFGSVLDDPCSGTPITDLGYNVFGRESGCQATESTSIEAEPLINEASYELSPGSPAIDRIPLELCSEFDALGRARTDGNNDGTAACDSGALEYGYASVEVDVRTTPYWRSVGKVDLSSDSLLFVAVMSGGPIDPTTIVFDSIVVGDFPRSAMRGVSYGDKNGDGLPDYNFWYRLDRDLVLECRDYDEPFTAMTDDGQALFGRLQFEVVGCTP